MNLQPRHLPSGGFSLVELLTAMAIGSLVLVAAATILAASNQSAERLRDSRSFSREQSEFLRRLADDLSSAVARPQSGLFIQSGTDDAEIRFHCLKPEGAQPRESRLSDLCAVRYVLADFPSANGMTRCLARQFVPSREWFMALKSGQSSPSRNAMSAEPVVLGVVRLEISQMVSDGRGNWTKPMEGAFSVSDRRAIKLRIVLASPSLRSSLRSREDWNSIAGVAALPPSAWSAKWRGRLFPIECILPMGPSA